MNTEIQHDKAAAARQHMLAILDIVHAADTTDTMRRWIARELRDLADTIRHPLPAKCEPVPVLDAYDRRGVLISRKRAR